MGRADWCSMLLRGSSPASGPRRGRSRSRSRRRWRRPPCRRAGPGGRRSGRERLALRALAEARASGPPTRSTRGCRIGRGRCSHDLAELAQAVPSGCVDVRLAGAGATRGRVRHPSLRRSETARQRRPGPPGPPAVPAVRGARARRRRRPCARARRPRGPSALRAGSRGRRASGRRPAPLHRAGGRRDGAAGRSYRGPGWHRPLLQRDVPRVHRAGPTAALPEPVSRGSTWPRIWRTRTSTPGTGSTPFPSWPAPHATASSSRRDRRRPPHWPTTSCGPSTRPPCGTRGPR